LPYNFTGCFNVLYVTVTNLFATLTSSMSLPTVAGAAGGLGLSRRCVHADVWRWCQTHSMSISYTPGQSRAQADVFRECGGRSDTLYLISRRLSVI